VETEFEQRVVKALDSIAKSLEKIANPLLVVSSEPPSIELLRKRSKPSSVQIIPAEDLQTMAEKLVNYFRRERGKKNR
jgi:hypothetical protein